MKQINPQIINLIELSDYINDTIHNIWFFLVGALLFFIGSLTSVKSSAEKEFNKVLFLVGIFAFIFSLHYFLKGVYDNKFWPMIKKILDENYTPSLTVYLYLSIIVVGIVVIYYLIAAKNDSNRKRTLFRQVLLQF